MIQLEKVPKTHPLYQEIRNRHYVENHGCIGRQLHYFVRDAEGFNSLPIGIISGASAAWACKPRDEYFKIIHKTRAEQIQNIIDNVVFRLEKNEKNLATQILAQWRKQVVIDWEEQYGAKPLGFETFVDNSPDRQRYGTIYRADNWDYVGMTSGTARKFTGKKHEFESTTSKMIFCKWIKKHW